jgi:prophage regulatory protein
MDTQTERFLRIREVMEKTSLRYSTVWDFVAKNKFPQPIKLSARVTVWLESEVDAYMLQAIDQRDQESVHWIKPQVSKETKQKELKC